MYKDIVRYDGLKEENQIQKMIIKGYELDLNICEGKLQLIRDGKTECELLHIQKDDVIIDQDKKLGNVKTQRNILGGSTLLLLLVLILI